MINSDFLSELKRLTESHWKNMQMDPGIYGFQFQPGTEWNPGLSEESINEYENILRMKFPHDFRALLRAMNGTDLPTLNLYGSSGHPTQESAGVYSYPRDLETVKHRIEAVDRARSEVERVLAEQGFDLPVEARLAPIFSHRFVVCTSHPDSSVVLSIHGADAIVYGSSLQEYLTNEFLKDRG